MLGKWRDRLVVGLARRLETHMTESRMVRGVRVDVVNTRSDISTERLFKRAEAVLDLLKSYQPFRLVQLRRDVASILIKRYPCRGAFLPDRRACLLELTFIGKDSFSDEEVASSLVHEATHARLDGLCKRYGILPHHQAQARHERICRRAELAFGRALPRGEAVVTRALASLALDDDEVAPDIDWRLANQRAVAADLDAEGAPKWLKRILFRRPLPESVDHD
jgi:hypothetical protein